MGNKAPNRNQELIQPTNKRHSRERNTASWSKQKQCVNSDRLLEMTQSKES